MMLDNRHSPLPPGSVRPPGGAARSEPEHRRQPTPAAGATTTRAPRSRWRPAGRRLDGLTVEQAYDAADIPSYCGRGRLVGVSADNNAVKIVPIFCKRWQCPHCGPLKQARWTRILLAGKPERHITLTCKPYARATPAEAAAALKRSWSRFVDHWRRKGYTCEYAWTLQYHRNGWPHLHILQRGHYIPHKALSTWMARYMSSPIVYLRLIGDATATVLDIIRYVQTPLVNSGSTIQAGARIYTSRGYRMTDDPSPTVDDDTVWTWTYQRGSSRVLVLKYLLLYGPEAMTYYPDGSVVIDMSQPRRHLKDGMDTLAPADPRAPP